MDRVITLAQEAMFDVIERDYGTDKPGDSTKGDDDPGRYAPSRTAGGIVLQLLSKTRMSEETILEWLPLCRALQYVHAISSGTPACGPSDREAAIRRMIRLGRRWSGMRDLGKRLHFEPLMTIDGTLIKSKPLIFADGRL